MADSNVSEFSPRNYETIFISDVHLGARGCQADRLLKFLQRTTCNHLVMVGDIIDGWQLKSRLYWPDTHMMVVREILKKSRTGTKITYVTGNHDEFLRRYSDVELGNIQLVDELHLETKAGKKFLVIHGDQFDVVTRYARWLSSLGDVGYNILLKANVLLNKLRAQFGFGYWSLAKWAKDSVKQAVNFIGDFESAVSQECSRRGFDGVVCGHIHKTAIRQFQDIEYLNCGDWVESCTAILQRHDGGFEIFDAFQNQKDLDSPTTPGASGGHDVHSRDAA